MMKKSKLALAVLATTVFAVSASALVACGKGRLSEDEGEAYEITFDANGGTLTTGGTTTKLMTDTDGKLTSLPDATNGTYTFDGWYTAESGGTKISLTFTFNKDTTVYAQWGNPAESGNTTFTITFNAGDGEFANGSKTYQATTDKDGKIPAHNDILDPAKDNCEFLGWTLNGTTIDDVYSYTFTADETLYADYSEEELSDFLCLVNDNEKKINMTLYDQPDTNGDGRAYEYQVGEPGVALSAGDVITFSIKDDHSAANTDISGDLEFFVSKTGNGIEAETTKEKVTSVKILNDANYCIYLKWYDADGDEGNCFVLDISDKSGTGVTVPGEIVEDAPEVAFTLSDGSTIDLKSIAVEAPDTAKYQYTSRQGSVSLTKGEVITVTIEGAAPPAGRFGMRDSSHGIEIEGNTIKVLDDGYFTLYFRYYEATAKDEEWWEVEMSDGKTEQLTDGAFYIVGGMNGWTPKQAYELVDGTITVDLAAGVEFKVATYKETAPWTTPPNENASYDASKHIVWYPGTNSFGYYQVSADTEDGIVVKKGDDNLAVAQAGKYTITVVGTAPGAEITIEPFGAVATEPEHTITVDAGEGTYNGAATLTTNDKGRLMALPSDPTPPDGKVFVGWFTQANGKGTQVSTTTKFTDDGTIYAFYKDAGDVSDDGLYVNGVSVAALTPNSGNAKEVMATGVTLDAGAEFKLAYDGEYVTDLTVKPDSSYKVSQTVGADGTITITDAGIFDFYYNFETKELYVGHKVVASASLEAVTAGNWYLMGGCDDIGMDWANNKNKSLKLEKVDDNTYTCTVKLSKEKGDNVKFVYATTASSYKYYGLISAKAGSSGLNSSTNADGSGNITVATTGTYKFTLTPGTGTAEPTIVYEKVAD